MKALRMGLSALLATATVFTAPKAFSYDEDTHFYGTYAMARWAGIRHEVANKIALSAQWMDESYISDPTSMILLPVTGVKKRRLLHFPSSRVTGSVNSAALRTILGMENMSGIVKKTLDMIVDMSGFEGEIEELNFFTETQPDHPFASELMMAGLKAGDLMMASAHLHVLEDSFAHAGTPAEQGHAAFWHWPDRPYASPAKYEQMVRAVMAALVGIRTQLPPEALDCKLVLGGNEPNCKRDSEALASSYWQTPEVRATILKDVLKDKEYVRNALQEFTRLAIKANYIALDDAKAKAMIDEMPLDGKTDAYKVLENVIKSLAKRQLNGGEQVLRVEHILLDMGRIKTYDPTKLKDYIASFEKNFGSPETVIGDGFHNFIHLIAHDLLRWHVPLPITDSHRMEIEDTKGPIRKKEMELRIRGMRQLISKLYGIDILFLENVSKDERGFGQEIRMEKEAITPIPSGNGSTFYATFTLAEKNRWDKMIFNYLFPNLSEDDLLSMVNVIHRTKKIGDDVNEYRAARKEINNSSDSFVMKKARLLKLNAQYAYLAGEVTVVPGRLSAEFTPLMLPFIKSTVTTHIVPSEDNLYYRTDHLFADYREKGVVKPLLSGNNGGWTLEGILKEAAGTNAPR